MKRDKSKITFARKLRREMTDSEHKLWYRLRARQFSNVKFRRQHPIGPYITDFCCIERKLVIELDGGQHNDSPNIEYDQQRTAYLNAQGFRVIRFWDFEVLTKMDWILERIWDSLYPEESEMPSPYPSPTVMGEGTQILSPIPSGEKVSVKGHKVTRP